MFWVRRRTLLRMIATYKDARLRIAGKPEEHRCVVENERRREVSADSLETADSACRKTRRIPLVALWTHHPDWQKQAQREANEQSRIERERRRQRSTTLAIHTRRSDRSDRRYHRNRALENREATKEARPSCHSNAC